MKLICSAWFRKHQKRLKLSAFSSEEPWQLVVVKQKRSWALYILSLDVRLIEPFQYYFWHPKFEYFWQMYFQLLQGIDFLIENLIKAPYRAISLLCSQSTLCENSKNYLSIGKWRSVLDVSTHNDVIKLLIRLHYSGMQLSGKSCLIKHESTLMRPDLFSWIITCWLTLGKFS